MENKEEKRTNTYNRRDFVTYVLRNFKNKDYSGIRKAYDGFIQLINNDKNPEHREVNEDKRRILERLLNICMQEDKRQFISSKTPKEVLELFEEDLLSDKKRKYDMSFLLNKALIADTANGQKDVNFREGEKRRYTFEDTKGRTVIIQPIGTLLYKTAFGIDSYLNQYRVMKQTLGNTGLNENYRVDEVFSNISIPTMMEDEEYKKAVLDELLSENNIDLSRTGKYIGSIVKNDVNTSNMKIGEEDISNEFYGYKINDKYAIQYQNEDASAVLAYTEQQEKEKDEGER